MQNISSPSARAPEATTPIKYDDTKSYGIDCATGTLVVQCHETGVVATKIISTHTGNFAFEINALVEELRSRENVNAQGNNH